MTNWLLPPNMPVILFDTQIINTCVELIDPRISGASCDINMSGPNLAGNVPNEYTSNVCK